MKELDEERLAYYDMSLSDLINLFPNQYDNQERTSDPVNGRTRSHKLKDLIPRYKQWLIRQEIWRPQTIDAEIRRLNNHSMKLNWLNRRVNSLPMKQLNELLNSFHIEKPTRKEQTYRKDIKGWSEFFDYVVMLKYIKFNPITAYSDWVYPVFKEPEDDVVKLEDVVYGKNQLRVLRETVADSNQDYRFKAAIYLMMETGIRVGECLALSLNDISRSAIWGNVIDTDSPAYFILSDAYLKGIHQYRYLLEILKGEEPNIDFVKEYIPLADRLND